MSNVPSAPVAGSWRFRLGIFIAAFGIHLITLAAMVAGASAAMVAAIAAELRPQQDPAAGDRRPAG
jgi:hypothetical protein